MPPAVANQIARAATSTERITYGPWKGSMRSVSADLVPPEYVAESDVLATVAAGASSNYLYLPRSGTWKRRAGTTQVWDTFATPVGMLPAKWGAKCRQLEEFALDDVSQGTAAEEGPPI